MEASAETHRSGPASPRGEDPRVPAPVILGSRHVADVFVGHHPDIGAVAVDSGSSPMVPGLLREMGFAPLSDHRTYILGSGTALGIAVRIRTAVTRLRRAGATVYADVIYDPAHFS